MGWTTRQTQLMRRRDHWPRGNSRSCTRVTTNSGRYKRAVHPEADRLKTVLPEMRSAPCACTHRGARAMQCCVAVARGCRCQSPRKRSRAWVTPPAWVAPSNTAVRLKTTRAHQGLVGGGVDGAGQVARPAHRCQLVQLALQHQPRRRPDGLRAFVQTRTIAQVHQ